MFRCFRLNAVLKNFLHIMHKHGHTFLGTSVFDCMTDYLHTLALICMNMFVCLGLQAVARDSL